MRLRALGWGITGILVVSGCFAGGVALGWHLTGEERLAVLTGFAFAALGTLAYLVVVLERFWSDMERQIAGAAGISSVLSGRIDWLERELATLADRLQDHGGATTAELTAEVQVLRTMIERLAGTRPDGADSEAEAAPRADMVALLHSALQESRVDLYLQPIVELPGRRVVHYEGFSRLRDVNGAIISPSDYISEAERSGLVSALDNLLLFRCINLARKLGPRRPGVKLFVNLSGRVLEDQRFLSDLVKFICAHRGLAIRVALEAAMRDLARLPAGSREHLARLSRLGFTFSIDNVTDPFKLDPAWLADMNVQFVKVDAATLLTAPCPTDRAAFCARFRERNITLIATRVEDEETLAKVATLGVQQAQGYLFGEPKPARADLDAPVRRSA
ncbi:EAL domain-containing protein [Pedomonas sp. V897]|uniref:EAL domain-containing protein n=1 Tax=Pedomonas sp. V897 TaxID=3446482 RepID=UPI003EDE9DFA